MKLLRSLSLAVVCLGFLCQCASNTAVTGEGANQALDATYKAARIANIARVLGGS